MESFSKPSTLSGWYRRSGGKKAHHIALINPGHNKGEPPPKKTTLVDGKPATKRHERILKDFLFAHFCQ